MRQSPLRMPCTTYSNVLRSGAASSPVCVTSLRDSYAVNDFGTSRRGACTRSAVPSPSTAKRTTIACPPSACPQSAESVARENDPTACTGPSYGGNGSTAIANAFDCTCSLRSDGPKNERRRVGTARSSMSAGITKLPACLPKIVYCHSTN